MKVTATLIFHVNGFLTLQITLSATSFSPTSPETDFENPDGGKHCLF